MPTRRTSCCSIPQNVLEFATGLGFRTDKLQRTSLRLGQGFAGAAAERREMVHIPDLRVGKTGYLRAPLFLEEGFQCYFGVPLIAKGRVRGVLEVFHRRPLNPDRDWLDFLEALAGQAAIAVENGLLIKELQKTNFELRLAYDTTIEGWSRALDLRDRDTEGHTQRVTYAAVKLGRRLGISEAELVHIRRGAMLHDIGKMAIPDSILLKQGPLTVEEWDEIRRHPRYAYELLKPIEYLGAALDIPHYHHERWDGGGYPDGLKGNRHPPLGEAVRRDRCLRRPGLIAAVPARHGEVPGAGVHPGPGRQALRPGYRGRVPAHARRESHGRSASPEVAQNRRLFACGFRISRRLKDRKRVRARGHRLLPPTGGLDHLSGSLAAGIVHAHPGAEFHAFAGHDVHDHVVQERVRVDRAEQGIHPLPIVVDVLAVEVGIEEANAIEGRARRATLEQMFSAQSRHE